MDFVKQLEHAYIEHRARWIQCFGDDDGFHEWFRGEVIKWIDFMQGWWENDGK